MSCRRGDQPTRHRERCHNIWQHHRYYHDEVEGIEFEALRTHIEHFPKELKLSMSKDSPDLPHTPSEGVKYPPTLRITSRPVEDHKESALDHAERWEQGEECRISSTSKLPVDASVSSRRAASN